MNDCMNADVRDALPDLLNGNLSEAEAAVLQDHVDGCADCSSELALLREVKATAALAPAMDIEAIAAVVPGYAPLAATASGRRNSFGWAWKIAAAAAIVTVGVVGVSRETQSPLATQKIAHAGPPVVAVEAPAISVTPASPSTPKTETSSARPEEQVASLAVSGLQDLSDADIEQLLSDLNGMEALPSAEPSSVTNALEDSGTIQ